MRDVIVVGARAAGAGRRCCSPARGSTPCWRPGRRRSPRSRRTSATSRSPARTCRAPGALPRPFEDLAARVREGTREERFAGAAQLPNIVRRPWGPGWALAGDAGCHKDPYLALGMCDAFRDADLLSGALVDGLGGARPLEDALAGYEQARDQATLPDFELNLELARLGPPPPFITAMRARCRGSAEAARQFFLVGEGRLPMPAGAAV